MIKVNNPLISVVVPVYNMEKYLERCINSLITQTYENLEIILVNDCSTDNSEKIIENYIKLDDRIKCINHKKNSGLFQARITGSKLAKGKYLAFVDSDDYISIDWYRKLLRQAEDTSSDMVIGEWCFDTDGVSFDYCNLDHFRVKDYCLKGSEIMDEFMKVHGRNFSWTVVWNKLYRKDLWDKCLPLFEKFSKEHGHMIMWEDIAFSSALWANAQKVTNIHNILYYYYKHREASTIISNKDEKYKNKYINDSSAAIKFFKSVLESKKNYEKYKEDFKYWQLHGMSIVYKDLVINLNKNTFKNKILEAFNCKEEEFEEPSSYFYSIMTPLHQSFSWFEEIKKEIVSVKTKYVSFDIFDTLIQRPFLKPSDIFQLLSEKYNKTTSAYINFKHIREVSERSVREILNLNNPSREDITLDEIYQYIKENYVLNNDLLDEIKQYEIDLELHFCTARKTGKELFDLALEVGKEIIICSDMYLSKDIIEKILVNNDIVGYKYLFVSSELEITKEKKSLYNYVQKFLKIKDSSQILHIGDNWYSDVENSKACGWRSAHLAKATDLMLNYNPGIYGGEAFNKIYCDSFLKEDYKSSFNDFTSVRSILAMSAIKFFDNPYVSVNPWSDFNANPKFIGYSILGPHLLALCKWVYNIAKQKRIGTIHFVARDGFLVKKAFDTLRFSNIKSNYIRLSRKALVLADVEKVDDIYSIFNKINLLVSLKDIAKYLSPIIPKEKDVEEIFFKHNFKFDKKIKSYIEFEKEMKIFIEEIIDINLLPKYKQKLKEYFEKIIKPGDYIFDIGYSGRPEASLSSILGFPVGSMYIHINGEIAGIRQNKYSCPCEVFYEFKPSITGVMREHLISELGPSTTGYKLNKGQIEPVFEEYNPDYCSEFITKIIQDSAIEFINDFKNLFNDYEIMNSFQNEVISAPFEYYLHYSKEIDRKLFSTLPFEDDLGEGKRIKALEFWNQETCIKNLNLGNSVINNSTFLPDLYADGYFVKFYHMTNRLFPKGGKSREILKKIAGLFLK